MTDETRTPAQLARQEQLETRERITSAGLPLKSASNRAVVNNTSVEGVDSQGISGALELRSTPDVSFNRATYDALEHYDGSDPLAAVEQEKREGYVRAMQYRAPGISAD